MRLPSAQEYDSCGNDSRAYECGICNCNGPDKAVGLCACRKADELEDTSQRETDPNGVRDFYDQERKPEREDSCYEAPANRARQDADQYSGDKYSGECEHACVHEP
jgi:hypothetical protein